MTDEEHAVRLQEPAWAPLFYEALEETGVVELAIKMVGRPSSKRTYYRYRKYCRAFARTWQRALENHRRSVAKDVTATA